MSMNAINKKPSVLASGLLAKSMHLLSKAALIDVLIDRAALETGRPDDAADNEVAEVLHVWIEPVLRLRGDRPVLICSDVGNSRVQVKR